MIDDDDEEEHARNFLYAAMESKVKSLFPPPSKEWPGCKNAFECMQAPDWRGWVWAARMEKQSWQEESVFKIRTKQDRDRQRNTYPLNEVWTRKWHDMRVKKLKELQREGIIALRYCKTCQMLADLYTKNVNAVVFERLANLLTGRSKMSEVRAFFAKFVR